ncbi:MAG: hypothetical protein KTR30_37875 [Saprospiraceae bacterium]|nr:hypothetical protein [Saprospiraceae bacterium]
MPADNEKFVTLLGDAKSLCKAKLATFTLVRGEDDEPLQKLATEARETYEAFADPKFKLITFSFDEFKIRSLLGDIDDIETDGFADFETKLSEMLHFLKDTALKEAVAAKAQLSTEIVNAEILAALTQCATKITQRINAFADARPKVNILNDGTYQRLHRKYDHFRDKYRTLLKDKTIKGTESDVISIDNRAELIATAPKKSDFLDQFEKLSNFIQGKVKAAQQTA